jgi:hypothetical protein
MIMPFEQFFFGMNLKKFLDENTHNLTQNIFGKIMLLFIAECNTYWLKFPLLFIIFQDPSKNYSLVFLSQYVILTKKLSHT